MRRLGVLLAIVACGCSSSKPSPEAPSIAAIPEEPPGPIVQVVMTIPYTGDNPHDGFRGAAISPDGGTVVTSIWGEPVKVRDVPGGTVRQELGEMMGVKHMFFTPDGKTLAGVGWGPEFKDTVLLWNTAQWERTSLPYHSRIDQLNVCSDSRQVFTCGIFDSMPTFWDIVEKKKGKSVEALKGQISVAVSSDINHLFWPRGEVGIWDIPGEKELPSLPFKGLVAASPDGKTLLVGKELVDWKTGKVQREFPLEDLLAKAVFSPSGRVVATSNQSGVKLWDVASGKELIAVCGPDRDDAKQSARALDIQFAHGGKHLLTRKDKEVKVWQYREP